jgi:hypothetical protein
MAALLQASASRLDTWLGTRLTRWPMLCGLPWCILISDENGEMLEEECWALLPNSAFPGEEWSMARQLSATTRDEKGQATVSAPGSHISRVLTLVEICILIGAIVLFNVFPEKVGLYSSAVKPYLFVPLITPEWLSYMPWLNVWWGLALTLALIKLVCGRWTQTLRWADLGLHLLSIGILAGVVLGYAPGGFDPPGAHQHAELLFVGFKACLGLVLVAQIVGLFARLAKLGISIPVLQLRFDGFRR